MHLRLNDSTSLPQATTQRLMIRLMSRYASQYLGGPRR